MQTIKITNRPTDLTALCGIPPSAGVKLAKDADTPVYISEGRDAAEAAGRVPLTMLRRVYWHSSPFEHLFAWTGKCLETVISVEVS